MFSFNNKVFLACIIKFIPLYVILVILANWMPLINKFLLTKGKNFRFQIPKRITVLCFQNYWTIQLYLKCSFIVFFVFSCICWLILSRKTLLVFPIFDLEGLIKRHEILFGKSSLWSFIVIYASVFYRFSILSDVGSFSVTLLGWLFTLFTFCWSEFLYVFVIFSSSSFLYLLWLCFALLWLWLCFLYLNETWHWANNDVEVAVQSWLWVRVELMDW